jgi:predicted glutamine amidotransferase
MRSLIQISLFIGLITQPVFACKLWAVCVKSGQTFPTISETEKAIIQSEITSFYHQSETMLDGWALLGYNFSNSDSIVPITRSDSPATEDSALYWNSVETLLNGESTFIGMGHLRVASSGTSSIPNPHPWMFYANDLSYSLIHNGTVSKDILYNLITENGTDLSWLDQHEPQTFGAGSWRDDGWGNVVDSELILLYIMQHIDQTGNIVSGLQAALLTILNEGVVAAQLNIIFSNGENLYVFGGSSGLSIADSEEHFAVMTQPASDDQLQWQGIENQELVIINDEGISRYPDFVSTGSDDPSTHHPKHFKMHPAYPNPFNGSISFILDIFTTDPIDISIYSIVGTQVDQFALAGSHWGNKKYSWHPVGHFPTGTYIIQASTKDLIETQKILFIK